jgi:hypothetical protein
MATDFRSANSSPEHARDALRALGTDRGRLADGLTAPTWYHPAVSALTAAAAIAPVLPEPWALVVPAVFMILIGSLPVFIRRNGIAMSARAIGRIARVLLSLQVGTLLVLMVTSAAVRVFDLTWWLLVPIAGLAFGLILFLGRRYDRAQHTELCGQEAAYER